MIKEDLQELLNYLKALVFDIKTNAVIPQKFAADEDFLELDKSLKSIRNATVELSAGNLSYEIQGKGFVIGSLKNLQASLRNITWKTKAIATGDFSQSVHFLGDFSDAFNSMTQKLASSILEMKEAQEHFEMVFHTIPDATLITSMDEGNLIAYNKAFLEISQYTEAEIRDEKINMFNLYISRDQRGLLLEKLRKDGFSQNMEVAFQNKDKEKIIGLISSKIIKIEGEDHILSVIRDITPLKKIEKKLQESEERHRLLADNAADVIWTMDLEGKFTYVSPSVQKLRGYSVDEVLQQSQEELLCPGSLIYMQQGLENAIRSVQNNQPFNVFRGELEQPCKDGSTVWTETTVSGIYNENSEFIGMLGVSRDISERKNMEEEIRKLSVTDKLTQIYNRLKLDETLEEQWNDANKTEIPFSLMIVDIDHFKFVNDTFGHQAGDIVLVELANILEMNVGSVDVVGRWGGEEFLIILPKTDRGSALLLAEKLRMLINEKIFTKVGKITASFGVADYNKDSSPDTIVFRADSALYKAKENGRNRVEYL
ncbi:sensor domain-containing diguanylate cyclase [Acetobacterium bakii]|uniref:sensor domain-containing diguanylate cyclase n=1 Tax=Acetobacterium bakii TaxID=52689 RepID=UPI00068128DF|nr:diguanylate cyclase [Acetobacterium bakii]